MKSKYLWLFGGLAYVMYLVTPFCGGVNAPIPDGIPFAAAGMVLFGMAAAVEDKEESKDKRTTGEE
jgi:hypothetical protein